MKRIVIHSMFFVALVVMINNAHAQCTSRSIIKYCKGKFDDDYKYSGCWMKEFWVDSAKWKRIEGHFVVMEGLKYQLLFCNSPSADKAIINIYDRSITAVRSRKLIESSETHGCNLWKFEPPKSGEYYVEYLIPPTNNGKARTGCIMLMIGTIIETPAVEPETPEKKK